MSGFHGIRSLGQQVLGVCGFCLYLVMASEDRAIEPLKHYHYHYNMSISKKVCSATKDWKFKAYFPDTALPLPTKI